MAQPGEYFNGLLATDLEALALLPRATFRVVTVPPALPCQETQPARPRDFAVEQNGPWRTSVLCKSPGGDSSDWISLRGTSRSQAASQPMSRPGRDGLSAAKTRDKRPRLPPVPLASAPAVDRTVQAVYRPIKLDASMAEVLAYFQGEK